jgi:hypothetical protein
VPGDDGVPQFPNVARRAQGSTPENERPRPSMLTALQQAFQSSNKYFASSRRRVGHSPDTV